MLPKVFGHVAATYLTDEVDAISQLMLLYEAMQRVFIVGVPAAQYSQPQA